jgi:hypothetical protein
MRQMATSIRGREIENSAQPDRWKVSRLPPNSGALQAASTPARAIPATTATIQGRSRGRARSSATVAIPTGRAGRHTSPDSV